MEDKKQQQMRQDIQSFKHKKDYYDILGISKSASQSQIKKAYRTLALKYHPDKNKTQGALQVFKKVSNAYSILNDVSKRQHYDRYGVQQQRPQRQRQYQNHQDYQYQQYNDIFNAFFGHAQQRGNVYTFNFGGNGFRQRNVDNQQGGISFYYIFIIIFVVYTIFPLFQSKPNYSSTFSGEYRYKQYTSILNVEFYVNDKYAVEARNIQYKKYAEMMIDRQNMILLEKQCQGAKRQRRRIEEIAYRQKPGPRRDQYIAGAKQINLNSCKTLNDYRSYHEDYVRDLTYMR